MPLALTAAVGARGSVYSTNFNKEVAGSSFATDFGDAVRLVSNAQKGTDTYCCSLGDHTGNSGQMLRFNGVSAGRIWEKNVPAVRNTSYSFSMWVRPVYNGSPGNGITQKTIQLKANGVVIASPTISVANAGCDTGWQLISGSWTTSTSGSVPFTMQMASAGSW